ncbi:UbiA family prenyltransferase [Chlamydia suis]|uniref:UbiA-like polyprenyltransferase n=1 Tax=Chlamydia suis TaxID=83559 RepID=UPI0009AFA004|nr:UbiA-like polyprenyltransferase [Chlamydia suis]QYC71515.1 UbiA family prenyltransferase [Chlamydia suis]QYC72412.1 UbiA family prenyltransferase [Chlamydia suis]QYC73307.1 UbiA family prenyltransferase [Chlamydia suis]QYC78745.1 UbiA family prenyltransferase [Chlamydia suis]QYC79710.1 UbiA family prenyltransferase [Chlamydia suis]
MSKVIWIQQLINFKHAWFALLFLASSTVFYFSLPNPPFPLFSLDAIKTLILGGIAFFVARSLGMIVNQIVDCAIDKRNPRTQMRVLPAELLSIKHSMLLVFFCFILFVSFCWFFNPLCFILAVLVTLLMIVYPYTKRFTFLCHWILGLVYYFAILMNFFAIAPVPSFSIFCMASLLGLSFGMIIAANDIIYAIQDLEFDRKEGLFSVPACFGTQFSIKMASANLAISALAYLFLGYFVLDRMMFYLCSFLPLAEIFRTIKRYTCINLSSPAELQQKFFLGNLSLGIAFLANMIGLFLLGGTS